MGPGGTLIVSRAVKLFPFFKKRFEELGFPGVEITGEEKDALNRVIIEQKPRRVLVSSGFYQAGTPYMMGRLLKDFPKLNVAAVNVGGFPDSLAAFFIWRGVKSYVNILEGYEEFHQGLQRVREGQAYVSPAVQQLLDDFPEWPETFTDVTRREMEVLFLICNGFIPESIADTLHVSRRTVNFHLEQLYKTFHVENREELEKVAFGLKLVTDRDLVFYDRKRDAGPLPDWAAAKLKMDRRLLKVC